MKTTVTKKMSLKLLKTLLLFSFAMPITIHSRPLSKIKFERFNVEDGLANPIVFDIAQDKESFIWFATNNGLSKYDGYEFTNFLPDETNPGSDKTISTELILDLMLDSHGLLWIATVGEGISSYDSDTGRFTHYRSDPSNPDSISHPSVYCIEEDHKGRLWIATLGGGVNCFDRMTGKFKHYRHDPDNTNSLANDNVYSILPGKNDEIWIGMSSGLDLLNLKTGKFRHFKNDPEDPNSISAGILPGLLIDSKERLWISSFGGGLNRYDKEHDKFIHYVNDPEDSNSISYNDQIRFLQDTKGNLWIPTHGGGLNIYDPDNDNFIHYKNNPGDPSSLCFDTMTTAFEDHSGVIWFATYGGGVCKYDSRADWNKLIQHDTNNTASLINNDIHAIYEDSDGIVWVGTEKGLDRYDTKTGNFEHFYSKPDMTNCLPGNSIWGIDEDSSGNLWIATNSGICKMSRGTGEFTQFKHDPNNPNSLNEDRTWNLCVDNNDEVWIGTQSGGVNRYSSKTGKFKSYDISNFVLLLKCDNDGNIWAGAEKGLYKFDNSKDTFIYYGYDQKRSGMIGPGTISAFLKDSRGNLWIGNSGGLYNYNKKSDSFKKISVDDGLIDSFISGILEEKPGVLWISTAKGLSRFNYDKMTFDNYYVGSFNRADASIKLKSGNMLFGKPNGLFSLFPDKLKKNEHIPKIVLTSFKVLNKLVETNTPLSVLEEYNLSYKDRFFSFEFAALDFSDSEKNKFKYKLEGFDDDWISLEPGRHFASYTNVPGGKYVFRVSGSNNDEVWNHNGISFKLNIAPPYWETNWFYTLVCLLVCMIISTVAFYIIKLQKEISERKLADMKVRNLRDDLENIINSMPSVLIGVDSSLKVTHWNLQAAANIGVDTQNAVGQSLSNVLPNESWELDQIRRAVENHDEHYYSRQRVSEDNKKLHEEVTIFPLESNGNVGAVIRIDDVTERAQMQEMMIVSEKLQSVAGLAAGMAHEINNPLSVITQGIQNIKRRLNPDLLKNSEAAEKYGVDPQQMYSLLENRKVIQFLDAGKDAVERAAKIVKNMLMFSRKSSAELVQSDLAVILDHVISLGASDYDMKKKYDFKFIEIQKEYDSNLPMINCCPSEIEQVLLNLFKNALQAMEEITTDGFKPLFHVRLKNEPTFIRIEIEDNGPGVPDSIKKRIFEPFFTTKPVGVGTGLGLSVSYSIVTQNHGGTFEVESEVGKGTNFIIKLPV